MSRCDEIGHTWTERGEPIGSARVWCRICRFVPDILLAIHERDLFREQIREIRAELDRVTQQQKVQVAKLELQPEIVPTKNEEMTSPAAVESTHSHNNLENQVSNDQKV